MKIKQLIRKIWNFADKYKKIVVTVIMFNSYLFWIYYNQKKQNAKKNEEKKIAVLFESKKTPKFSGSAIITIFSKKIILNLEKELKTKKQEQINTSQQKDLILNISNKKTISNENKFQVKSFSTI